MVSTLAAKAASSWAPAKSLVLVTMITEPLQQQPLAIRKVVRAGKALFTKPY
jgi:hypothetical protein